MTSLLPLLRASAAAAAGASSSSRLSSSFLPLSAYLRLGGVRHGSITMWNHDWKPGPYPTTPEQRAAAAKKYGLLVEDYEPDPNTDFGDYPKLARVGGHARDVYEDWDYPDLRRNFGEPLHQNWDCMTEDRYEPQSEVKGYFPRELTYGKMLKLLGLGLLAYAALWGFTVNVVADYAILPKQIPADRFIKGMKHYTFELKDDCDEDEYEYDGPQLRETTLPSGRKIRN